MSPSIQIDDLDTIQFGRVAELYQVILNIQGKIFRKGGEENLAGTLRAHELVGEVLGSVHSGHGLTGTGTTGHAHRPIKVFLHQHTLVGGGETGAICPAGTPQQSSCRFHYQT